MTWRNLASGLAALLGLILSGCSTTFLDTSYGRVRGSSINGTGVLAELFRTEGHTVRTAVRLTEELDDWAEVIVRFAPYPGPPEKDEAAWYLEWLGHSRERRIIYVPRDFDAEADYWSEVLDHLPKDADRSLHDRAEMLRRKARTWVSHLPPEPKEAANADDWFAIKNSKVATGPTVCKTLGGPWAQGVDPARAAVSRHETIKVEAEIILLEGDGEPLAIEWSRYNASRVLAVANGSFLLNEPLVNPARRPLARRVVLWAGSEPSHVAFVEGRYVLGGPPQPRSVFELLEVPPFGWVMAQLLVLGLAGCLARAARLGRPRVEPPSGEDRPASHPEALGALLARTGQAREARALLENYRRWRAGPGHRPPEGA
jgi:hypothetical protein